MSDEYSQNDDNYEIIEEDIIVEEFDESIYTVDIKQENDTQSLNENVLTDNEENVQIVCLGKDENTGEDVFHCALCNETFAHIENHLKENHSETEVEEYNGDIQMLEDEEENNELSSPQDLNNQFSEEVTYAVDSIKTNSEEISCQKCDYVFQSMDDIELHQCKDINLNQAQCNKCQAIFDSEDSREAHRCQVVEDHPPSIFSCPKCPKKFSLINLLQEHQKSHTPKRIRTKSAQNTGADGFKDEPFEKLFCEICNTHFTSVKNLKLHSKMHLKVRTKTIKDAMPIGTDDSSNKDQFYCEICNKSFDYALLSIHKNMHQNVEEHICRICNRQFENRVSYDMHMQLHVDQPTRTRTQQVKKPGAQYACNYCGIVFFRPHEKVKHERIHTGEKPHECEVCGKSFRVSYSLTLHLRTHTDIRPFVCAICNKRFKAYAVYSHHLNTHSEDRPYKCPTCPKSFRTSVQLCGHKNSHTKPYNCPECNRPFSSLYAVKMHMKTHNKANKSHENLKHRCGICGAVYARSFALKFHMKDQHPSEKADDQEKGLDDGQQPPVTADDCFNEDDASTQAIMQGEEIIIDNFHTEEIVTDWLTNK